MILPFKLQFRKLNVSICHLGLLEFVLGFWLPRNLLPHFWELLRVHSLFSQIFHRFVLICRFACSLFFHFLPIMVLFIFIYDFQLLEFLAILNVDSQLSSSETFWSLEHTQTICLFFFFIVWHSIIKNGKENLLTLIFLAS